MPEMRRNPAKAKLAAGGVVTAVGGVYTAQMADFVGTLGVEGVWLEAEHGPLDFADIEDITRACDLWGMASICRSCRHAIIRASPSGPAASRPWMTRRDAASSHVASSASSSRITLGSVA